MRVYAFVCVCVCMRVFAYPRVFDLYVALHPGTSFLHTCMYVHMYIYIYIYIHTCMHNMLSDQQPQEKLGNMYACNLCKYHEFHH
jgi:hypothetical protein